MFATRVLIICLGPIVGCSTTPPYPPHCSDVDVDPAKAVIGMSIRINAPTFEKILEAGTLHESPSAVLVKIGDGEDIRTATTWLPSTCEDEERVYRLDVEPGEYVVAVVGSGQYVLNQFAGSGSEHRRFIFLSEDVIQVTRVDVQPGEVVFLGELVVDRHGGTEEFDPAQRHYQELLDLKGHESIYAGTLQQRSRDRETEVRFWRKTAERYKDSPWVPAVEARLKELQAH